MAINGYSKSHDPKVDLFRRDIRSAVYELTRDNLFQLSLIIIDQQSFGNKLILLVSKNNLYVRYIKDKYDLDFWCEIKAYPALKAFFPLEHEYEHYLEGITNIQNELEITSDETHLITSTEGWIGLENLLSVIGASIKIERKNFIQYINDTSLIIRSNIDLIMKSLDENNRENTLKSAKLEVARDFKSFFESYGQKLTDVQLRHIAGLDDNDLK
jgi:hypothetical protein